MLHNFELIAYDAPWANWVISKHIEQFFQSLNSCEGSPSLLVQIQLTKSIFWKTFREFASSRLIDDARDIFESRNETTNRLNCFTSRWRRETVWNDSWMNRQQRLIRFLVSTSFKVENLSFKRHSSWVIALEAIDIFSVVRLKPLRSFVKSSNWIFQTSSPRELALEAQKCVNDIWLAFYHFNDFLLRLTTRGIQSREGELQKVLRDVVHCTNLPSGYRFHFIQRKTTWICDKLFVSVASVAVMNIVT